MKKYCTLIIAITIQCIALTKLFALFQPNDYKSGPIAVIINSELYSQVKDSIDRYLDDLQNEGYKIFFFQWDYPTHSDVEELRTLLKEHHQNHSLQGAVLIGQLPYAKGKVDLLEGPIETYLMDLKSANFIKNNNGEIIEHQGQMNLDIWISRIWAQEDEHLFPGMSEGHLITQYFEKNHHYRTCQSPVTDLKIKFYTNEEFPNTINQVTEYLNSWKDFYKYVQESGCPQEYLDFVKNNPAQYLQIASHSSSTHHSFEFSDRTGLAALFCSRIDSTNIGNNAHINQPFIILEACSASKFTSPKSLGNAYLFGKHSSALVIAGLTVPGCLVDIQYLHSDGNNFGMNAQSNFNTLGRTSLLTTPIFVATTIFSTAVAILRQDPSIILKAIAFISGGWELVKYHHQEDIISVSLGFTLLGDPTLKSYIDMTWCPAIVNPN